MGISTFSSHAAIIMQKRIKHNCPHYSCRPVSAVGQGSKATGSVGQQVTQPGKISHCLRSHMQSFMAALDAVLLIGHAASSGQSAEWWLVERVQPQACHAGLGSRVERRIHPVPASMAVKQGRRWSKLQSMRIRSGASRRLSDAMQSLQYMAV